MTAATKSKAKAAPKADEAVIVAYKAFKDDWSCRGFKYEIGKTYEHTGDVSLCASGFHACTVPFDCWEYYPGATALAKVTLAGVSDQRENDSKLVAAKITIEASITLPVWIKTQVETVLHLCKAAKVKIAGEKEECAAATGYSGHAAATGVSGHAAATGNSGHAAATGISGHAAATGYSGHAAATGVSGHAAATGVSGHAAATGVSGHAAATGYSGHAAATGYSGHAAATGDSGHAAATGISGHAAATGDRGHAAATGDSGHAAATGISGHAAATGDRGHAAVKGKDAIAASIGYGGTATAEAGGAVMLANYDDHWNLIAVFASKVGENGIEAGKTYRLDSDGKPQEVTP